MFQPVFFQQGHCKFILELSIRHAEESLPFQPLAFEAEAFKYLPRDLVAAEVSAFEPPQVQLLEGKGIARSKGFGAVPMAVILRVQPDASAGIP